MKIISSLQSCHCAKAAFVTAICGLMCTSEFYFIFLSFKFYYNYLFIFRVNYKKLLIIKEILTHIY